MNRLPCGKCGEKKETQDHDENNRITLVELFALLRNVFCTNTSLRLTQFTFTVILLPSGIHKCLIYFFSGDF